MINIIFAVILASCQPVDGPCLRRLAEDSKAYKDVIRQTDALMLVIDKAMIEAASAGNRFIDFPADMPKDVLRGVEVKLRNRNGLTIMSWSKYSNYGQTTQIFIRISWLLEL